MKGLEGDLVLQHRTQFLVLSQLLKHVLLRYRREERKSVTSADAERIVSKRTHRAGMGFFEASPPLPIVLQGAAQDHFSGSIFENVCARPRHAPPRLIAVQTIFVLPPIRDTTTAVSPSMIMSSATIENEAISAVTHVS